MDNFYKQILKESPIGYAYHKIHLNTSGLPCDYEFVEVNEAFELLTGLKEAKIIGEKITDIMPGIEVSKFDWIKIYGDVALGKGKIEFEHFSEPLQRYYRVKAYSPKKYYFVTQFSEISSESIEKTDLDTMLKMSDQLLQLEKGSDVDYQYITDCLKKISDAKFVIFNLYEDDGKHYNTVAVSGDKGLIRKGVSVLGFKIKGPRWEPSSFISDNTKADTITRFSNLETFAGDTIPKAIVQNVEKLFKLGEVVFLKIAQGESIIGDFQLFMGNSQTFFKDGVAEIFTKQVGNAIARWRAERDLLESEQCYKYLFEDADTAIAYYKPDGTVISFNKKAASNMGGTPEDYAGKSIFELFPKEDATFYMNRIVNVLNSNRRQEYTDYIELNTSSKWFISTFNKITDKNGKVSGVQIISQDITNQRKAEEELKESEERFSNLFERAPLGYQSLNNEGRLIEVNEAWLSTLGYHQEDVIGKWFGDFLAPDYVQVFRDRFLVLMTSGQGHAQFEMLHKNGEHIMISFDGRVGYKKDGSFDKTHCILKDVTTEQKLEKELEESESQFRRAVDAAPIPIMIHTEDGKVLKISKTWSDLTGYELEDIPTMEMWLQKAYGTKKSSVKVVIDNIYSNYERQSDGEFEIRTNEGQILIWDFYSACIGKLTNGSLIAMSVAIDITERKKSQEQIMRLSYCDQLTGLYNRRFYEAELNRIDVERNLPIALVMADVNGLKLTNDAFGHQEGDHLLQTIANILKKSCRSDEIISRIGGDEFVILLPHTGVEDTHKLIERINCFTTEVANNNSLLSLSIGFAIKDNIDVTMEDVFKNAEDDMYRHKLSERSSLRSKSIDLIMNSLFEKSGREMQHSKRVGDICELIASNMYFSQEDSKQIRIAGLVHDIGKIGISNTILDKKDALTNEEYEEIKKHSEAGYRILCSVTDFSEIAKFVLSHHERWDGLGYPQGLKGDEIPIQARIIAVADAYDAMTSNRTYRNKMDHQDAIREVLRCSGTQFDPFIVKTFTNHVDTRCSQKNLNEEQKK